MELEVSSIEKNSLFKNKKLEKINKIQLKKHVDNIFSKKSSDMLGWLDLVDISDKELEEIECFGARVRKRFKNF